jgi:uncharacterized protein YifE (UPF0438 family)
VNDWRKLVRYPETFSEKEQGFLDSATDRILKVLIGQEKPATPDEKSLLVNCTKSIPSSEQEKALAKFVTQLRPEDTTSTQETKSRKINYDHLASGSGHGNKTTRLHEQRKDRWGKEY